MACTACEQKRLARIAAARARLKRKMVTPTPVRSRLTRVINGMIKRT